jgi:hypothetical protein
MNIFDPDSTHDRLFAQRIKPEILTLLKNAISTRGIFDNPMPVALIEREAPAVLSPWASDWSGKMFEFLKPLSRTFILDDGYLNGSAYGFEPQYTADLPDAIDLEEYHLDRLTVRVAPKTDGIITWLERTHDEQSAPYCSKLTNNICIAMRRSKLVRNQGNEALEIELPTKNWLHNSVCFSRCELVGLSSNQSQFLLYDSMTSFLDYLMGLLNISPCKVLTGCTAKLTALIYYHEQVIIFDGVEDAAFPERLYWLSDPSQVITYNSPIFSSVPHWWHNASLGVGGGSESSLVVSGESTLSVNNNYVVKRLSYWGGNPVGQLYSLNNLLLIDYGSIGYDGMSPSTLKTSASPYVFGAAIEVEAAGNKIFPCFPYPISLTESENHLISDLVPAEGVSISTDYEYEYSSYAQVLAALGIQKDGIFHRHTYQYATNEDVQSNLPGDYGAWFIQGKNQLWQSFSYYNRLEQVRLSHEDEVTLFKSGQIAYIKNHIAIKNRLFWEIVGRTFLYTGSYTHDCEGVVYNDRHAVVITYDATNPLNPSTFKTNLIDDNSIAAISSKSYAGMTTANLRPLDRLNAFLVETEVPLNRTFRSSPLSDSYYDLLKGADFIPSETELQQILFPNGPDGTPYLDPDTDGGDIMPDSIRIKEIHAALDAQRFAEHPASTEEDPKVNLRTLGRLIEAASYVLGVNFDEDGNNVPYPDPVLFDPEKITEINEKRLLKNAQFAVAEMNGGLDTSSIYEVRSPIVKQGRKGAEIDQRPHAIKYHNLPQLMDAVADDNAKMFGGGKNAVFQVPSASGDDYQQYEGIFQALADTLYMEANNSKAINELQNQSIKTVWLLGQILKALGVPCGIEKVEGVSGLYDKEGKEIPGYLAVPKLDPKSPTLTGLFGIVLMNLQQLVGGGIGFKTDEETPSSPEDCEVTIVATPQLLNAKNGGTAKFTVTRKTKKPEDKDQLIYVNLLLNSTLGKGAFSDGFKPGQWSIDLQPGEGSKSFSVKLEKGGDYDENHSITAILSGGEGYKLGVIKTATVAIIPGDKDDEEEEQAELKEEDWKLEFTPPDPAPDFVPTPDEED